VCRRLGGTKGQDKSRDYDFIYGKGNENHQLGKGFFVHQRISAIKTIEFF
jgi:hypothetical protein